MDHDSFLNNLIEHSELYKNFTEKDLKKFSEDEITPELKEAISLSTRHFVKTVLFNYSLKDLMKLFIDDEQDLDKIKKSNKTLSKYFNN